MILKKGKTYQMIVDTNIHITATESPANLEFPILGRINNNVFEFDYIKVRTNWFGGGYHDFYILSLILTRKNTTTQAQLMPLTFMVPNDVTISDSDIALTSGAIRINDVTPTDFQMILIRSDSEPERVNKSSYFNIGVILTGVLRESSSLINPSITIEYTSVPSYNYAFIPMFNRWYYINNTTFVSHNIWLLNLSVDALMSYKDEIIAQKDVYIERQEFSYDLSVVDPLLTSENRITITETEYTNTFFFTDVMDRYSHTYESASPVVVAIGGIPSYVGGATDPTPDTSSQALRRLPWESFGLGLVTLYNMQPFALSNYMMSGNMADLETIFSDLGEYIVGCKCFPFDVTQLATSQTTDNPVKIGGKNATGLTGVRMNAFNNLKTIVSSFDVPRKYNDFRDFAPYTRVSIFLPYIGYVDLPTNDVMGKTGMTITYAFDLIDGTCQAFIRTGNRIIVTTDKAPCALDLPINQKNNSERLRNLALGSLNILTGGIASMAGDASKGASSLKQSVSPFMGFLTEHVTKGRITGGWQSMNSPTSVTLVVETEKWVDVDMDEFKKLHGRPCHKTYDLADLVGFTQVGRIHLENINTATSEELASIESQLKNGVIL